MIRLFLLNSCVLLAALGCARFGFEGSDGSVLDGSDGSVLDGSDGSVLDGSDGDSPAFSWQSLGPEHWPELQQRLQDAAAQGSTGEPTARLIPNADLAAQSGGKYQGAILAPNGRIYGIPRMASQVVELEPFASSDPAVSLLGPMIGGADNWYGAALAWNGMIYCSVSDNNFPLRVDPDNLDNSAEITVVDLGTEPDKWVGLRVVPNGKLLSCPRSDEYVLEINIDGPTGVEIRRVGPALGTDTQKWWGGVLAPNGKIYCLPNNDTRILEIDPEDLTATGIKRVGPDFGGGSLKWWSGALAPNGRIYAAPNNDSHVLEIIPDDIDRSGRIGPDFGTTLTWKWTAGTLAPNGKIYALPWQGSIDLLEIDPHARANFDMDVLLNGHLNGQ